MNRRIVDSCLIKSPTEKTMLSKNSMITGVKKTCGLMLVLGLMAGTAQAGALPPGTPSVPEIDPSSIMGAMALLSGGIMLLTDRRRAKA